MTSASDLLSQVPQVFDDLKSIKHYKPRKIRDSYGYQYLLKGSPTSIRGSIHREWFLESASFGLYDGAKIIISTKSKLSLGDLIEYNNELFAVKEQTSFNKVMDLNHFICESAYGYYADFIIDDAQQAQKIIGTDCGRYLLQFALEKNIPLIASKFQPSQESYFAFDIRYSNLLTSTYRNKDNKVEQCKQDSVDFYAVNMDTNASQNFLFELQNYVSDSFGVGNFLSFSSVELYSKSFDIKANVLSASAIINYKIIASDELPALKKIEQVFWNINFDLKEK